MNKTDVRREKKVQNVPQWLTPKHAKPNDSLKGKLRTSFFSVEKLVPVPTTSLISRPGDLIRLT